MPMGRPIGDGGMMDSVASRHDDLLRPGDGSGLASPAASGAL